MTSGMMPVRATPGSNADPMVYVLPACPHMCMVSACVALAADLPRPCAQCKGGQTMRLLRKLGCSPLPVWPYAMHVALLQSTKGGGGGGSACNSPGYVRCAIYTGLR